MYIRSLRSLVSRCCLALVAASLLAFTSSSRATITVYTSLADFNAATTAQSTDTYSDLVPLVFLPSTLVRTAPPYGYTANTSADGFDPAGTGADPWLSTVLSNTPITFNTFTGDVRAIGGNFFGSDISSAYRLGTIVVSATDADGTTTRVIVGATTSSFLGFVSNKPIVSLTVSTQGLAVLWATVDNLVLASATFMACCDPATGACSTVSTASCPAGTSAASPPTATCSPNPCRCSISNGGFETGDFTDWTQFGSTSFSGVGIGFAHTGSFNAFFGPVSPGGIRRTIPANPGDMVSIAFWLQVDPGVDNFFSADFDSQNLIALVNDASHPAYSEFTFSAVATTSNPTLSFTFTNPPAFSRLDDVSVCIQAAATCCDPTSGACTRVFPTCPGGTVTSTAPSCTPQPCPQPTACCDTTSGACTTVAPLAACPAGTLATMSSTCTAGLCPQPTACCNTTSGACTVALPGAACPVGFIPGSPASTTCTPGLCPQPFVCCDITTGACSIALPRGTCAVGTIALPAVSSCTPQPCPQPTACCNTISGVCTVALPGVSCAAGCVAAPAPATSCMPYPCPAIGSRAACADCTWLNGEFDNVNGQDSHLGGGIPNGSKAADDFYLCGDFIYDLNSISVTLFTTTLPGFVKPRAEIYSDCSGCPGTLLYTLDNATIVETGGVYPTPAFDGRPLRIVYATWFIDSSQPVIANRNIVLKGGTYWLSVYGRTDNLSLMNPPMYDVTYWGTAGRGVIKGLPAKKIVGTPSPIYNQFNFGSGCLPPNGWMSVTDLCCIGCTDLSFSVCTKPCKVLIDNGEARRQLRGDPVGSTSQYAVNSNSPLETRSADDFVVPPCQDYTVCYVEGCVLTNCPTFEGVFEIYNNDCHKPSYTLHGTARNGPFVATKIIPLGFQATMDGKLVTAYKLEFHDLSFQLSGGTHYWISMGVRYTFSINEHAFFCYNADCARNCLVRWNTGRVLTAFSQDLDFVNIDQRLGWAALNDDFSFLLAADGNTLAGPINGDPPPAPVPPSCNADFNRDGVLNVADIFDYLSGWFRGCP